MNGIIKKLRDNLHNIVFPVTVSKAVYMEDGQMNLDQKLTAQDNKIGNLSGNGITESSLAEAVKNDRSQLADKANQSDLDETNNEVSQKANKKTLSSFGGLSVGLGMCKSSMAIQVFSDSTGNETNEWVYLLSEYLASKYPNWNIKYKIWDDTAQDYVVNYSLTNPASGDTRISGGTQTRTLPAASIQHISGDLDIRVKLKMPSWKPSSIVTPVSRFGGSAAERSWYFSLLTDGRLQFNFSTTGSDYKSLTSPNVNILTNGDIGWIRVVFDADNGAGGYSATFYQSFDGVSWGTLQTHAITTGGAVTLYNATGSYELGGRGQSGEVLPTGAELYEVDIRDGYNGTGIVPRMPDLWEDRLNGATHAVSGAPTLTIVNGAHPGANMGYLGETTRLKKLAPYYGQTVILVSDSHNEGQAIDERFRSAYSSFIDSIASRFPNVPIVAIAQNPQSPSVLGNVQHSIRRKNIYEIARKKNLEVLDVYAAFPNDPTPYLRDSVHPNDAGEALWRDVVIEAIP